MKKNGFLTSDINLTSMSKAELIMLINNMNNKVIELEEKVQIISGELIVLRKKIYGRKSEKSSSSKPVPSDGQSSKKRKKKIQQLSERYPDAEIEEIELDFKTPPICNLCSSIMTDSGMTEDSEYLSVWPKEYRIIIIKRKKYRCSNCHGSVITAPLIPRIKPGGSYSDEMIIDVSLSKYCDLIPMERYAEMAARQGFQGLPPHSLIECTHYMADFLDPTYNKIKQEVKSDELLFADETTHKMLEGDFKNKSWYLWGFSTRQSCYFEIHNTRSGDVASEVLTDSNCQFLMSDKFSGYAKAIKIANKIREKKGLGSIGKIYCNAHARRKFKESGDPFVKESKLFLDNYKEIYKLEGTAKGKSADEVLKIRGEILPYFEEMKLKAPEILNTVSNHSSIAKAINYFLSIYDELTIFAKTSHLPIDNNHQESLLRNHVIGRKTWFGTHSKRGAETNAKILTVVENCKLLKINPRDFMKELVTSVHDGKEHFTPLEYWKKLNSNVPS